MRTIKFMSSIALMVSVVSILAACGGKSQSGSLAATPAAVAVTPLNGEVDIAWPAMSGATSYNIYYSTTPGLTTTTGTKIPVSNPPYVMAGLTNGTPYYFVVTAVNASGVESAASSQVSASSQPSTGTYITATVLSMAAGGTPPWGWLQQVGVYTDSSQQNPITSAGVTVNGTALTYNALDQHYEGKVAIAAGAGVTVDVTVNSLTYSVSGTQYSTAPGISAPVSGWQYTNDNTITWTPGAPINDNLTTWTPGAPIGSSYYIGIMDSSGNFVYPTNSGNVVPLEILEIPVTSATIPGACSWTIPANSITTAGNYTVYVALGTSGLADNSLVTIPIPIPNSSPETFLPESRLWIGLISTVPVTVQ